MDGRNNQFNPQNTQNRQLTNALPTELNHIIQNGVTPEQFAENARQLETYSRMNAMALQVYLQRQSQEAEQRRQDEQRVIQLAQQLASGSQQRLQLQQPPPPPPVLHNHHSLLPHQAVTSNVVNTRPTPVIHNHGHPYNKANANNIASQHWSHVGRPQVTTVQPQHPQTVNTSAFSMNQNVYSPHEVIRVSHPIRGSGSLLASAAHTSQIVQQPKAASTFVQQTPQYSHRSGIAASGSQANTGLGGASVAMSSYGVNLRNDHLKEVYPSWVKAYGAAKAASMVSEYMHSWRQGRPINPMVPSPMQSTFATPIATVSAQNPQIQSHFQIPVQERIAPLPHPQTQEWRSSVPMTLGQQAASQPRAAAPSTHVPLPPPADVPALNTAVDPAMLNATNSHNDRKVQPHHPGAIATNPALTSTGLTSAPPALPTSQPGSTQSILLGSEEKGSALYTMRGLAASIKRSLNAERLAAAAEPSPSSDSHTQKRGRSSSAEVVDNLREVDLGRPEGKVDEYLKAEPQPATLVPEPDEPLSTMLPVSFPEDIAMPQQETIHTPSELAMPSPPHESAQNFVPFSTLTGAVSFDDISGSGSASHNAAPSSEALEDLSTAHPTPEAILHNHIMEVPLIPVSQPSFDPLSFPHRTPTPPLAATITAFHDEDEVDEKTEATPSSHPSSVLHEEEIDSQLQLIPSGSEDDVEMRVDSGEGHAQAHFNIRSPLEYTAHSEARDDDSPMQETDVFVRRTGLLDSSTGEIDRRSMESPQADDHPASETRSPTQVSEEQRHVFTKASSTEVRSPASGLQSRVSRRSRGKQEFYIAVPPPSEWVLRAKHREAERKALVNEKSGQHSNREYTECDLANRLCPRHCHWNGCQAVLNSMYALKQHVRRHQLEVKPVRPAMTVSCRWKQCRMVCERSSLLLHLNRHIDKGVACIYDDCDEQFSHIQDLAEHEKNEHADDEPPPSAVPRPPDLKPLAALPQTVPSYTTTTRPASRPSITAERHARLGPWTLGMIIGHPTAGPNGEGSNTGLRARRTTRLHEQAPDVVATPPFAGIGESGEMRSNLESVGQWAVYDVLEEPCVGRGRVFGELDTVDVTREFYEGVSVRGEGRSTRSSQVSEDEGWIDQDSVAVEALL